MKIYLIRLVVVFSVLWALSGCSMKTETPPQAFEQQENLSVDLDNRYYLYIEAQLHRKKGEIDKAIQFLKRVIALEGDSVFLSRELAALYMEQKKPENALVELEKILDNEPMDVDTLILYGRLNQNMGRLEKAKDAYEKTLSVDAKRERVYNALGRIYMAEEDMKSAARVYRQLIKHYPGSFIGHFYMGKIYAKQGKRKKAEKAFEKTLVLEPGLLEPRFELIELLRADGGSAKKRNKIIRLYEDVLAENPDDARAAVELGLFYHEIGRKADAEEILIDLGQRANTDKIVLTMMVREYFEKGRYRDVKTVLLYMLKGAPESSELHYVLALALNELEEKDLAVENFAKVMPDSRFFTNAVINTALIYQEKEKLDDAVAYLQSAIRKVPDNTEFMLYLGTIFEEQQAYERAEKILKQGLEKDDQDPKLFFRLGVVYDKWGRKDDCIATMKTVILDQDECIGCE